MLFYFLANFNLKFEGIIRSFACSDFCRAGAGLSTIRGALSDLLR